MDCLILLKFQLKVNASSVFLRDARYFKTKWCSHHGRNTPIFWSNVLDFCTLTLNDRLNIIKTTYVAFIFNIEIFNLSGLLCFEWTVMASTYCCKLA